MTAKKAVADAPKKKRWDVNISTEDGKTGSHIWVMAFTADEAIEDALALAPEGHTKVNGKPKDITNEVL